MSSGIYTIVNSVTGKIYVGSSKNIATRQSQHLSDIRRGCHCNKKMQNAFYKYGESSFSFVVIEMVAVDNLIVREQFWIDLYRPFGMRGYNIQPSAGSNLGVKFSVETRQRMRDRQTGKTHSIETKNKIRASHTGMRPTKETRNKLKICNLGRKHSEQAKTNMGNSRIGLKRSEDAKKSMSEKMRIKVEEKRMRSGEVAGVSVNSRTGKWIARKTVNGTRTHIGTFLTREDANMAVEDFLRML